MERKNSRKLRDKQREHTSPARQQIMDTPGKEVANLLKERLREGAGIDLPSWITSVANSGGGDATLARAFEQILGEPKAFDLHYYALAGMRTLADEGRLSSYHAQILLDKTERQALRFGNEEFYETIGALAWKEDTASVLLGFVDNRLLGRQDIPDWRYLAFVAISAIIQNKSAKVDEWTKARLRTEAQDELQENPERQEEIEEFIRHSLNL